MSLTEYFANVKGTGILATSDSDGNVDVAIYGRPYVIDENTFAFSMLERLSLKNMRSNPKAAYMFIEQSEGHAGKRFYLTMTGEEKDAQRIKAIRQILSKTHGSPDTPRHLLYFTVDKTRPLVGDKT